MKYSYPLILVAYACIDLLVIPASHHIRLITTEHIKDGNTIPSLVFTETEIQSNSGLM